MQWQGAHALRLGMVVRECYISNLLPPTLKKGVWFVWLVLLHTHHFVSSVGESRLDK